MIRPRHPWAAASQRDDLVPDEVKSNGLGTVRFTLEMAGDRITNSLPKLPGRISFDKDGLSGGTRRQPAISILFHHKDTFGHV